MKERSYHRDGTLPQCGEIFVFGSNLAGRHGAGSAKVAAERFGAIYGIGRGRMGQSYAIPTKDGRNGQNLASPQAVLPLSVIHDEVARFIEYAKANPHETFFIVRIGCQLAGYSDKDIAPMFKEAPENCSFPEEWRPWLDHVNKTASAS